jgi:hypothetical protein
LSRKSPRKKPESGFSTSIFIYHEQNEQLDLMVEHLHLSKSKIICRLIDEEFKHKRLKALLLEIEES